MILVLERGRRIHIRARSFVLLLAGGTGTGGAALGTDLDGLLGAKKGGGTAKGSGPEVRAVSGDLTDDGLGSVAGTTTGQGNGALTVGDLVGAEATSGGEDDATALGVGGQTDGAGIGKTRVLVRVDVDKVVGLSGELDAGALDQEAGLVLDEFPSKIGGHDDWTGEGFCLGGAEAGEAPTR